MKPIKYSLCLNYNSFNSVCQAFFLPLLQLFSDCLCLSDNDARKPCNRPLQALRILCINDFQACMTANSPVLLGVPVLFVSFLFYASLNIQGILAAPRQPCFSSSNSKYRFQVLFASAPCYRRSLSAVLILFLRLFSACFFFFALRYSSFPNSDSTFCCFPSFRDFRIHCTNRAARNILCVLCFT